jgi:hypothetical protein
LFRCIVIVTFVLNETQLLIVSALEYLQPLSISSPVVLNRSIFVHMQLKHSLLLAKMIISVNQNETTQNTVSKPQD